MCAVIQRGILGGFKNKIGNVVGTSWKGIAVMKSLPLSVANPQTSGQVAQRSAFSATSKFGSAILSTVIKPLWDRFAQRESGFNAFVQTNIAQFAGGFLATPLALKISKGTLVTPVMLLQVADVSAQTYLVTWDASSPGDANPDDVFYGAAYNNDTATVEGFTTTATRADGTVTLDAEIPFALGETITFWGAFRKADGTKVSNTAVDVRVATA